MTTINLWSWAALGAILLLALALRISQMHDSLWLDELHTAWVVDGGLREIPSRAAIGNQSPLYFYLPWATTRRFGLHEVALRLPSLVAGLAVIVAIYALVWRMTSSHAGALLAAWLAAIEPNFLWYSLEARPYAWVQLVGVLQVFAFWQVWEATPSATCPRQVGRWRIALVALSILLFYMHYTAVLLVAAEVVYFVAAKQLFRETTRYTLRAGLSDFANFALFCLPSVVHLQAIAGRREAWWKFVSRDPSPTELLTMFPLVFTVGLPLLIVVGCYLVRWWRRAKSPEFPAATLLLAMLWLAVPLLLAFAATRFEVAPLWMRRYVIVSAAAPLVVGGALCAAIARRWVQIAAAMAIAVCAWSLGPQRQFLEDGRFVARSKQDWRAAVSMINDDSSTNDWPVLVRSGLIEADELGKATDEPLREYCLSPISSIYRLSNNQRPLVPLPYSLHKELLPTEIAALSGEAGFWLITPGNDKTRDRAIVVVGQSQRGRQGAIAIERAENFGGVWVMKVRSTERLSEK